MTTQLSSQKCVPCEAGTPPLTPQECEPLLAQVPGWQLVEGKLVRKFKFKDFREAIAFVNKVAALAEEESHHPDLRISWNKVTVELFTHSIKGLSQNDFVMAAKIGGL